MNLLHKYLTLFALMVGALVFAQTKSEVWVNGNCETCKARIERASKDAGATSADWNSETKILQLDFDPTKTDLDKILKKISEVGHDNQEFSAPDNVYSKLPDCCKYERKPAPKASDTHEKKTTFFVNGDCEMCKARIESTAKKAGALSANWDLEKKILNVDYDPNKVSYSEILKKITEAGHDNELYKTSQETYNALPGCCQYDRTISRSAQSMAAEIKNPEQVTASAFSESKSNEEPSKPFQTENSVGEVKLTKYEAATALSTKSADLTFDIGKKELLKAACCNLSESFETNATVDVSFSNAVTGTKQLKMLGLDQKYTAFTLELLPDIRGLSTAYGLNFIPGRWIGGIQLTKGGSTVTNGYESITGQINTEFLKFNKNPETALNVFADFQGRTEMNVTHVSKLSDRWDQSILLHGNGTFGNYDDNGDGFLDRPKGNQLNMAYLINYNDLNKSGFGSRFGINFLKDSRKGGQTAYNWQLPQVLQDNYGVGIAISRFQFWNKTGYIFKGKPYQSIGWMNQLTYHQQDSFFGLRDYFGKETTYYSNLIFESIIGNTNHKYKTGASFMYDKFNEDYVHQNYRRTESVPGIFAEYTQTGAKYTFVAGARVDFHNLAGTQFTPRLNFKYDITPKTIFRASAGRGFRTANVFAENQNYFASNRTLEIMQDGGKIYGLKPEIAWNYGVSLQQEFKLFHRKASWLIDFFRTDFQNQVLADLDYSTQKILFYNLKGTSFASSFQTQLDFTPIKNLEFRLAYKMYDVKATYLAGKREVPFMPKDRGFLNIAYATNKNSKDAFWNFDTTIQYVGKQRVPDTAENPVAYQLRSSSKGFVTWNAQVSRDFNKNIRAYVGGENLLGYMQKNPILDAANPFGAYFDGGMVYAPIMPANFYVGMDLKF